MEQTQLQQLYFYWYRALTKAMLRRDESEERFNLDLGVDITNQINEEGGILDFHLVNDAGVSGIYLAQRIKSVDYEPVRFSHVIYDKLGEFVGMDPLEYMTGENVFDSRTLDLRPSAVLYVASGLVYFMTNVETTDSIIMHPNGPVKVTKIGGHDLTDEVKKGLIQLTRDIDYRGFLAATDGMVDSNAF